ncbi:MAG: hypothetical protein Q8R28_11185 [Dehalococcoidia bacterium]|nr:hypothetical protein [Dehalococcoidia bacterium]
MVKPDRGNQRTGHATRKAMHGAALEQGAQLQLVCDACGREAPQLRHVLFNSGIDERVCRGCVETWAREFGGAAMDILLQWDREAMKESNEPA